MPKIQYQKIKFRADTQKRIDQANEIIAEYQEQGFDLTLRQLYYQFVSRGLIPNNDKEYKKLGDVVADGRLAGLIDWDAITDRTRNVRSNNHWDSPTDVVEACANQFQLDKWKSQPKYVEVWIEKDALIGVIEGVCRQNDVPFYACRGYNSVSEIWNAGRNRLRPRILKGKKCSILYLGDHDPSGIDMTRDVEDRLAMFAQAEKGVIEVQRLALNMDQVTQYNPPPNPTKLTDSRASDYIEEFGETCWELDALEPNVIVTLIQNAIDARRNKSAWDSTVHTENEYKQQLKTACDNWEDVVSFMKTLPEKEDDDGNDG